MRNKFLTKILGATLGLALVVGVGVGVANYNNREADELDATISSGEEAGLEVLTSVNFSTSAEYVLKSTDGYYWNGVSGTSENKWGGITKTLDEVARVTISGTWSDGFTIKDSSDKYLRATTGNMTWATTEAGTYKMGTDSASNPIVYNGTTNGVKVNGTSGMRVYTNLTYNASTGKSVALYKLPASKSNQTLTADPVSKEALRNQTITVSSNATSDVTWSIVNDSDTTAANPAVTSLGVVSVDGAGTVKVKAVADGYYDATIKLTFIATTADTVETLDTRSSLSYKYSKSGQAVVDALNRESTGITGSTYTAWSGVTDASGAVFAGKSAGTNDSIQLRTSGGDEGIITTAANTNGSYLRKVVINWESHTSNGRIVQIYGKNTAYSATTDLYDNAKKGTLIGSATKSNGVSQNVIDIDPSYNFEFIGVRSSDSAMYLSSINFQWGAASYTYTNVALRFGGIITEDLWGTLNTESTILGFGVLLSTDTYLGANTLKSKYAAVDGTNVKKFYNEYKPLSADPNDKPTLFEDAEYNSVTDDYYVWNLRLNLPKTDGKVSDSELKKVYAAVAFIVTEDDGVVFLTEQRKSAKTLANGMISGPSDSSYEGSLVNLANLA